MDENAILQRLDQLDENLNSLRSKSGSAKLSTSRSQGVLEFLLRNWVLLSFLAALLTAIYVKFEFGVDYFRDYRSIKTKHELSRFYLRMGDVLMGRGEWEAAETPTAARSKSTRTMQRPPRELSKHEFSSPRQAR